MRALVIGPEEEAKLDDLAKRAAQHPLDMPAVMKRLKNPASKTAHVAQMNAQSLDLPGGYCVTFTIEEGHPVGTCRHMSVSLNDAPERAPHPAAVWMIGRYLGFWGDLYECDGIWPEQLTQGQAINLVQRMVKEAK